MCYAVGYYRLFLKLQCILPHPNPPLIKATVYTQVLELPHPNPPLGKATVYTQVLELPHPNPPLGKGRGQESLISPLSKGSHCVAEVPSVVASGVGLRGVKPGSQSNSDLCVHRSLIKGREQDFPLSPLYKGSHCVAEVPSVVASGVGLRGV